MQHNPVDQIPHLITAAGFRVTGQGDQRHWVRYITATRPYPRTTNWRLT